MKKLTILFCFFLIAPINSQELNEDFLESLPDDIKKDLQEKNEKSKLDSNETYKPYLYSSKLRQAEELLSLKERLEADLLELERRLRFDDDFSAKKDLELFGSNFFNTFQTSFMPINEPNPSSDYNLDIGDVLNIQVIGQENYIENFIINNNGSIAVPDIGTINIAGLTLSQANSLIRSKINETYIGSDTFITLAEIRDVNVLVTGNAKNPGIYTLTGNSNILHAVSAAGGIGEYGSYREINLIRDNKVIESLDVYDLLINGKYNLKKRLRSGDVIFIEARKNIVTIAGAVNRPAKYEIFNEQTLEEIIKFSNGIKRTADRENISLERILDGKLKTIPLVNESQLNTIKAVDGDLIYIREYPYRQARITGAVLKPGSYNMAAGETIDDLIKKAGGFTENAYLFGAIYQNQDAKEINIKSAEILYQEFLDNILAVSQQNISQSFDLTPIVKLTEEIKNTEPNGRVVIDLINDETIDLYNVKEGDELFIPEKNNVVYVYGETSSEGAVMYREDQGVNYFVAKSGGFKKFADKQSIYILHPNGESQLYTNKRNIFESSPASDVKIYPGSIIFVPRELDKSTPRRLAAQAYVSILGNLGIALASLSSINNN